MSAPPEPPPGDRNPDRAAGQEPTDREVDDTFAALVAGWDPPVADPVPFVAPEPTVAPGPVLPAVAPAPEPTPEDVGTGAEEEDEGHFERPDAPPVTPPTRPAMGAIAVLVLGAVLVLVPGVVGLTSATGFPLGLVCLSGGLVFLLSRLRSGPPADSGWDDGAQL